MLRFNQFDLRRDFELPIFITFENTNNRIVKNKILKEFGIHGFLIKNHEKTILKMNGYPENIIVDESQKYKNREINWFAETWDGLLKFNFNNLKLIKTGSSSGQIHSSTWEVFDYFISNNFCFNNNIRSAIVQIDDLTKWLLTDLSLDYDDYNFETKIDSYQDIEFNNHKFSIDIIKGFEEEISSLQKKIEANVLVEFNFEDNLTKYETKLIIDQFRNLVQILTGMNIGVNKILVNQPSNWILSNLYLPSIEERSKNFSQTSYSRLRDKFSIILQKWFSNNRIQILSANFLHGIHYNVPLDTTLIVLVSGIEIYFSNYRENNKEISARKKVEKVIESVDASLSNFKNTQEMEKFSKLIIDNRVYRVHGTKRKNIIESEYELKEPVKQLEKYIYDFILHNLGV